MTGELTEATGGRFQAQALVGKAQTDRILLRLKRTTPAAENRTYEVSGMHLITPTASSPAEGPPLPALSVSSWCGRRRSTH